MKPKLRTPAAPVKLTEKQRLVCAMLCRGHSDRTIAKTMKLTIPGVRRHVTTLLKKWNSYGRTGIAIGYDRQEGKRINPDTHHSSRVAKKP